MVGWYTLPTPCAILTLHFRRTAAVRHKHRHLGVRRPAVGYRSLRRLRHRMLSRQRLPAGRVCLLLRQAKLVVGAAETMRLALAAVPLTAVGRDLPADLAYCDCTTLPCTPFIGQPMASGANTNAKAGHCLLARITHLCSCLLGWRTGENGNGQLGDGTTSSTGAPVFVSSSGYTSLATSLAAGGAHSCVAIDYGRQAALCFG